MPPPPGDEQAGDRAASPGRRTPAAGDARQALGEPHVLHSSAVDNGTHVLYYDVTIQVRLAARPAVATR